MKIATYKHIILGIGSFLVISLGLPAKAAWSENTLPVTPLSSVGEGCYVTDLYLSEDNNTDGTGDFGVYLNTNLVAAGKVQNGFEAWGILQSGTTVSYYTPFTGMFYKSLSGVLGAIDNNTFYRASFVFPYNTPVRAIATVPNKVIFQAPDDNDSKKNIVSIKYDYKYVYATNVVTTNTTKNYWYNQVPNINYYGNTGLNFVSTLPGTYGNKQRTWSDQKSFSTCRNFQLHRCGDGNIDNGSGFTGSDGKFTQVLLYNTGFEAELCDDGKLNGTAGKCSANCGRGGLVCSTNPQIQADQIECDNGVENNGNDEKCTLSCTVEVTIIPDLIRDEL